MAGIWSEGEAATLHPKLVEHWRVLAQRSSRGFEESAGAGQLVGPNGQRRWGLQPNWTQAKREDWSMRGPGYCNLHPRTLVTRMTCCDRQVASRAGCDKLVVSGRWSRCRRRDYRVLWR